MKLMYVLILSFFCIDLAQAKYTTTVFKTKSKTNTLKLQSEQFKDFVIIFDKKNRVYELAEASGQAKITANLGESFLTIFNEENVVAEISLKDMESKFFGKDGPIQLSATQAEITLDQKEDEIICLFAVAHKFMTLDSRISKKKIGTSIVLLSSGAYLLYKYLFSKSMTPNIENKSFGKESEIGLQAENTKALRRSVTDHLNILPSQRRSEKSILFSSKQIDMTQDHERLKVMAPSSDSVSKLSLSESISPVLKENYLLAMSLEKNPFVKKRENDTVQEHSPNEVKSAFKGVLNRGNLRILTDFREEKSFVGDSSSDISSSSSHGTHLVSEDQGGSLIPQEISSSPSSPRDEKSQMDQEDKDLKSTQASVFLPEEIISSTNVTGIEDRYSVRGHASEEVDFNHSLSQGEKDQLQSLEFKPSLKINTAFSDDESPISVLDDERELFSFKDQAQPRIVSHSSTESESSQSPDQSIQISPLTPFRLKEPVSSEEMKDESSVEERHIWSLRDEIEDALKEEEIDEEEDNLPESPSDLWDEIRAHQDEINHLLSLAKKAGDLISLVEEKIKTEKVLIERLNHLELENRDLKSINTNLTLIIRELKSALNQKIFDFELEMTSDHESDFASDEEKSDCA